MRVISGTARGTNLETLEGNNTRPTLDRVKEALFNIIQCDIVDAKVLDLFAGSGALGIEALSRGAKTCIMCDKSYEAIQIINKNIKKTHLEGKAKVIKNDYKKALELLQGQKFDVIFIDPPYALDIAVNSIKAIIEFNLLADDGIIILETDNEKRELENLNKVNVNVYDLRKYGRVNLIFLNRKG
ncbi:MAG: 16S rRNA (guanine(966)-N(2))-methyltransferase RsmD [Clostridia bacterium]|nr:16S rRNA (guanine(966)-N(2))-methyltransferase RsmD [Clostridia bacterium]